MSRVWEPGLGKPSDSLVADEEGGALYPSPLGSTGHGTAGAACARRLLASTPPRTAAAPYGASSPGSLAHPGLFSLAAAPICAMWRSCVSRALSKADSAPVSWIRR